MNLPKNKFYVEAIISLTNANVVIEQDDNGMAYTFNKISK